MTWTLNPSFFKINKDKDKVEKVKKNSQFSLLPSRQKDEIINLIIAVDTINCVNILKTTKDGMDVDDGMDRFWFFFWHFKFIQITLIDPVVL